MRYGAGLVATRLSLPMRNTPPAETDVLDRALEGMFLAYLSWKFDAAVRGGAGVVPCGEGLVWSVCDVLTREGPSFEIETNPPAGVDVP